MLYSSEFKNGIVLIEMTIQFAFRNGPLECVCIPYGSQSAQALY